jgi:hypothetical protein
MFHLNPYPAKQATNNRWMGIARALPPNFTNPIVGTATKFTRSNRGVATNLTRSNHDIATNFTSRRHCPPISRAVDTAHQFHEIRRRVGTAHQFTRSAVGWALPTNSRDPRVGWALPTDFNRLIYIISQQRPRIS